MLLWFLAGLALLVVGAELLVRGASRLAAAAGISPLVAGLTVVAFGTSAPELAVSASSSLAGRADVALGNVVGSNVFNVLLILGLSALITPLVVAREVIRREVPLMIALSAATYGFAFDGSIGRVEAALLMFGLAAYTTWIIRASRRELRDANEERPARAPTPRAWPRDAALVAVGLTLLVLGAQWLVDAAVIFARALEVSDAVVSLTIVAAGTSLPEAATSVVAAARGQRDIAVGNVVGSNLFNMLGVLGLAGVVAPNGLQVADAVLTVDLPVMLATAIACLPIFATGHVIDRWEGFVFLAYYCAYVVYLVLAATSHPALAGYASTMTTFVFPITALTFVVILVRARRRARGRATAES